MAAAPELEIGVIYTHERGDIGPLLTSLAESCAGLRARLLLVDNASATGVGEWAPLFPETSVLRNARRRRYAENLNRILSASSAPYVLLLNTDMLFVPAEQCPSKMVRFMDAHPQCGVGGCRLYHADGTYAHPARRFQTWSTLAARRLGLARWCETSLRSYFYQERDPRSIFPCDWLSGCFLMVRRAAYLQAGGLDEGFRKYFEDVDFCRRISEAGWDVLFNGETYCYHFEQRASRRLLSTDGWQHARSFWRYRAKWGASAAGGR